MKLHLFRTAQSPWADVPFFVGWSAGELAQVERLAEVVEYDPGEVVCSQGELAREFLLVLVGRADLLDGRARLGSVGPGDTVGVEALLTGRHRPCAVVAQTYLQAVYLGPREFHGLLAETPSFGRRLALTLADRLAGLQATA